jgi:hypothetical protein
MKLLTNPPKKSRLLTVTLSWTFLDAMTHAPFEILEIAIFQRSSRKVAGIKGAQFRTIVVTVFRVRHRQTSSYIARASLGMHEKSSARSCMRGFMPDLHA